MNIKETHTLDRVVEHIRYLLSGYSIRDISKITGWSKSTIYNDLTHLAENYFPYEYEFVKTQLSLNYKNRGIKSAKVMKDRRKQNEHNI